MSITRFLFKPREAEYLTLPSPQLQLANLRPVLVFDGLNDQIIAWSGIVPTTSPIIAPPIEVVIYFFMPNENIGTVGFSVTVETLTPLDPIDITNTDHFHGPNFSLSTIIPANLGQLGALTVPITNFFSFEPGDYIRLFISRDADSTNIQDT